MFPSALKHAQLVSERREFMTTLRRGVRDELRTLDGTRLSLEETLKAVEIPPRTRLHVPRVEHLLASRSGPVTAVVSEALDLPESFVGALLEFGAIYGCPVVPKTSPNEQHLPEDARKELEDIRIKAISRTGRSPRFQRPFRLGLDAAIERDSYLRVHVHPKRFPAFYDYNWKDRILFENAHCVVVNKPPGCQVPSRVDNHIECLTAWIQKCLKLDSEMKPVHRLDTGTEGIVFLAKTKEFAQYFQQLLFGSESTGKYVKKQYRALTREEPPLGAWKHYIKTKKVPGMSPHSVVHSDESLGAAYAEMELLESVQITLSDVAKSRWNLDSAVETLVELKTGRTHQIRVQLAHEGFPIIGDGLYNPDPALQGGRCGPDDESIGLQATSLEIFDEDLTSIFEHNDGPSVCFDAGVPWWRNVC